MTLYQAVKIQVAGAVEAVTKLAMCQRERRKDMGELESEEAEEAAEEEGEDISSKEARQQRHGGVE